MNEKLIERLLQEIEELEKDYADAKHNATVFSSESIKRKYESQADVYSEQIQRKMKMLDMLTRTRA